MSCSQQQQQVNNSQPTEVNPVNPVTHPQRVLTTTETEVNMQQYEHATTTQSMNMQQRPNLIIDGRIVSAIVGLFIVGLLKKFLFD